jgi:hypothetical protein
MSYKQRMALAWANLNSFTWDEFIGKKPENWDRLPDFSRDQPCKHNLIREKFNELSNELGEKATSWAWWKYHLRRSWIRWAIWYYLKRKRCSI